MMGYSNSEAVTVCLGRISERRQRAEDAAQARIDGLCAEYEEFAAIDRELRSTGRKLALAFGQKGDIKAAIEKIRSDNLAAQERRKEFLDIHGLSEDYIRPQYVCKFCGDTGFVGGERCSCLTKMIGDYNCAALNRSSPLDLCSFDTFDLSYYEGSDKTQMANILSFVEDYAKNFGPDSSNLLFYGNTGLGKTHLSLAAANVVLCKGFTVIYDQAQTLFDKLADERFSRSGTGETEQAVYECDLLIIDDLGAEFVNQMTQSLLYSVINTRLLTHKPMIISTNIPLRELDKVYHDRISSRLCFEFDAVPFVGRDIRQKRKH